MPCVVCESETFQYLFEKNSFRIETCSICGLVQVTNVPPREQVEERYDQHFYETYYADLEKTPKKQRYEYLNFDNKIEQIEKRLGRRGKILDVGCSFGFSLDVARRRGWAVTGIEVSEYAAEYARQQLGLSVINKAILDVELEKNSFDVITMWYVIEHLPNPKQVMHHLKNIVKSDGLLVVSTPNVESYRARIQGQKWRIWIPPEHLLYFSPETMKSLCSHCGLEVIDYETALPYEKYFRSAKLYKLFNKLKLSDNIVYYIRKSG